MTTNKPFGQWGETFAGDGGSAAAGLEGYASYQGMTGNALTAAQAAMSSVKSFGVVDLNVYRAR